MLRCLSVNPSEVTQLYWQLSAEGKIKEAGNYVLRINSVNIHEHVVPQTIILDSKGTNLQGIGHPIVSELETSRERFFSVDFPNFIYRKKLKLREILSEKINENRAKVVINVIFEGQEIDFKLEHQLYRDGNIWKIIGVRMLYER